jgi:lipase chaperone LimK
VCYEDLCNGTEVWTRLAEIAGITAVWNEDDTFRSSNVRVEAANDLDLAEQASAIYARLADRARAAL